MELLIEFLKLATPWFFMGLGAGFAATWAAWWITRRHKIKDL